MFSIGFILYFLQSFYLIEQIYGHGYLADPPARSSAWLFDKNFAKCCKYYNHIQMFCGGAYRQWAINKGKCSICGEAYDLKNKLFGMGDSMYLGKIVRTYIQGATIPVTVILTANHLGHFEFRICNIDDHPNKDATQSCLNKNLLEIDNTSTEYDIERSFKTVKVNVTLPPDLVCKHCVFQWKYITGNSWGVSNGKSCLGCGTQNEEFFGCSDIAIVSSAEGIIDSSTISTDTEEIVDSTIAMKEVIIQPTTVPQNCTSVITFSKSFDLSSIMEQYCETICPNNCASDKLDSSEKFYYDCVHSCKILCACN